MNLTKKLEKIIASIIITGSIASSGCYHPPVPNQYTEIIDAFPKEQFYSMKKETGHKKLALALIASTKTTNELENIENTFKKDFADIPNYQLYTERTENLNELFNNLRDYSLIKPIDALILVYHGNKKNMKIDTEKYLRSTNVKRLLKDYKSVFAKDAVIILYSCSTGKGEENIAQNISETLDISVIAPKYVFCSENMLLANERMGEFIVDTNKRLSFDYNNFEAYKMIIGKGKKGYTLIATSAHATYSDTALTLEKDKLFLIIEK
ncbi:MAG: DUF4347 domain-containing protein [Candidatus Woesearchaeota archaeon]